jgi:hypothetical protein
MNIPSQLLAECLRAASDGCYQLPSDANVDITPEFQKELQALMTLNGDLVVVSNLITELESGESAQ